MADAKQLERPRTPRGHLHAEAFCLMWYACTGEDRYVNVRGSYVKQRVKAPCGHRERYWNSRDGVTPFGTVCPSCGGSLLHTDFQLDRYAPDHKPHHGQRVWIDMTRASAEKLARERIAAFREQGHEIPDSRLPSLIDNIYNDGLAPDCVVWGYEPKAEPRAVRVPSAEGNPEYNILAKAQLLLEDASAAGVVLTIEQRPLQPLAMRHYESVASVRLMRGAA